MSNIPTDLKYTNTHEWVEKVSNTQFRLGITDHAQSLLGDIVFVELPEIGQTLVQGEECGVIESVKAASDMYAPVNGEVVAINEALVENPNLINEDPYHNGWMIEIKPNDETDWEQLLDSSRYQENITEKA